MSDGLDGVVACQTVLSHNDAASGAVLVRGHPIADLVAQHGYEGTIAGQDSSHALTAGLRVTW